MEEKPVGAADKPSSSQTTSSTLIVKHGERAFICGKTGSGKTSFACWQLEKMDQSPIIIYDTKGEPKFEALTASIVVEDFDGIIEAIKQDEHDYIVVRPPAEVWMSPERLDALLMLHYQHLHNVPAYIDETANFHRNAHCGAGLANLLQRGRSKGITLIMSTQRPARISRSCVSESQKFYIFRLTDRRDRKVFDEVIEDYSKLPNPKDHYFYFYDDAEEKPVLYAPVKLADGIDKGYTDVSGAAEEDTQDTPRERRLKADAWI